MGSLGRFADAQPDQNPFHQAPPRERGRQEVYTREGDAPPQGAAIQQFGDLSDVIGESGLDLPSRMLIYTSGTTGLPKGCLQIQRGSTTIDALTADAVQATERDVYMAVMPYFLHLRE